MAAFPHAGNMIDDDRCADDEQDRDEREQGERSNIGGEHVDHVTTSVNIVNMDVQIATRLQQIAGRLKSDTAERNRLILEAHKAGASLREIEKVAGITHVAVRKIIHRDVRNSVMT